MPSRKQESSTTLNTTHDPFPLTPEQMRWPFRSSEERAMIAAWAKRNKSYEAKATRESVGEAPF